MASSPAGKIFYGGGDFLLGAFFLLNALAIGGPASMIGLFLVARGGLTMIGLEF